MSKDKEPQATIKDFLIYVVKKRILPKQAVSECRKRKQEALDKGYSITVKDILLEQGYIATEAEYQKLWDDMQEDFQLRNKIAEKNQSGEQNISIPENMLEDLLTSEELDREKYADVPSAVLLAVEARWKKKKEKEIPRQPIASVAWSMTQRIMERAWSAKMSTVEKILATIIVLLIFGTLGLGLEYYWVLYGEIYNVQQIQIQISTTSIEPPTSQIQTTHRVGVQKLFSHPKD